MSQPLAAHSPDSRELTAFRIGEQEFCVDIMCVREIRGWSVATPLPQSPDYMTGVINLRGLAGHEPTVRSVIIVVQVGERLVGLLVDAVSDILSVTPEEIQVAPDLGCDSVRTFVKGLISMDGRMISEIAVERLLPEVEALAA